MMLIDVNRSYADMICSLDRSLSALEKTGFDSQGALYNITHLIRQNEFFYCCLAKKFDNLDDCKYTLSKEIKEHTCEYFNLGIGFPKELRMGHLCYIYKLYDTKALVIPLTSIKGKGINPRYEMDIHQIDEYGNSTLGRLNFLEMKTIDLQRINTKTKQGKQVVTSRAIIKKKMYELFIKEEE